MHRDLGMTNLQISRNPWGSFLGFRGILGFSQAERMFGAEFGEIVGFSESKRETGGSEMPNSGILRDRARNGEMAGRRNAGFSEERRDKWGGAPDAKSWNSPVVGGGGEGVGMGAQRIGDDESVNSQKFLGKFSGNLWDSGILASRADVRGRIRRNCGILRE